MKTICTDDTKHLLLALRKTNGKATAFTIWNSGQVRNIVNKAVARMNKHDLPKCDRAGAIVEYTPAGPWSMAYDYPVISTKLTLRVGVDGRTFYVVGIERCRRYPCRAESFDISLTSKAYANFMRRQAAIFGVRRR